MKRGRRGIFLEDLPPAVREKAERQYREEIQKGSASDRQSPALPVLPPSAGSDSPKGRGKPQKTTPEREMEAILTRQRQAGEILEFFFEGMTVSIGEPCCRYTPDFLVILPNFRVRLIETKGPFIREDALIKFKVANKQFHFFDWQLWQRAKSGQWRKLI